MDYRDLARAFEDRLRADQRKDDAVPQARQAIDTMTALPAVLSQSTGNIAAHLQEEYR